MKQVLFLVMLVSSTLIYAKDAEQEWSATSLTEDTIKKIQTAQYDYKKCVTTETQKKGYAKIESRSATDAIIKQCESVLSKMRKAYIDAKVPGVVADRHLKKMRIDITRRVLKQMMFAEAARSVAK